MIELSLPFPPTTNSIWRSFKGRNILSSKYRLWRELCASVVIGQMHGQKSITGPYHMVIELDRPDKRPRDCSNYIKAVEDSLVLAEVVRDDSDALSLMVKWSDRAPGKGAECRVEIEAAKYG